MDYGGELMDFMRKFGVLISQVWGVNSPVALI
jgi:hypothetical protein